MIPLGLPLSDWRCTPPCDVSDHGASRNTFKLPCSCSAQTFRKGWLWTLRFLQASTSFDTDSRSPEPRAQSLTLLPKQLRFCDCHVTPMTMVLITLRPHRKRRLQAQAVEDSLHCSSLPVVSCFQVYYHGALGCLFEADFTHR